eukprot:152944-Chlamydomonas_euryale.AAC.1
MGSAVHAHQRVTLSAASVGLPRVQDRQQLGHDPRGLCFLPCPRAWDRPPPSSMCPSASVPSPPSTSLPLFFPPLLRAFTSVLHVQPPHLLHSCSLPPNSTRVPTDCSAPPFSCFLLCMYPALASIAPAVTHMPMPGPPPPLPSLRSPSPSPQSLLTFPIATPRLPALRPGRLPRCCHPRCPTLWLTHCRRAHTWSAPCPNPVA